MEILVDNSAHPIFVDRSFKRHTVHITRAECLEVAAYLSGKLVLDAGAWLQRIVVRDENFVSANLAPMHLKDTIFQDVSIVVKIVWGKGLGDLNQPSADFRRAESRDFLVCARLDRAVA